MPGKSGKIKIMVANDQPIICDGLKLLLEQEPDLEVVACVGSAAEIVDTVVQKRPGVLILDVLMDGEPTLHILERLTRQEKLAVKVLMMGVVENSKHIRGALERDAKGYIMKMATKEQYVSAIRAIFHGLTVFDQKTLEMARAAIDSSRIQYTLREEGIIQCLVDGKTNKEIASEMNLTEGTIKNLVSTILYKSGATSRTQLVSMVLKERIAEG